MTSEATSDDAHADLNWLLSPRAVRQSAERIYAEVLAGNSRHFRLDPSKLPQVIARVSSVAQAAYPDLRDVPYHSRIAHFAAGDVDRFGEFCQLTRALPEAEQLRSCVELIITSVLLDAGAGPAWRYAEGASGQVFTRSEGLAVASYRWFASGALSSDPGSRPQSADASRLAQIDEAELAAAFQVGDRNPLCGLTGRALLLRRLAAITMESPYFAGDLARPGNLVDSLRSSAGLTSDGRLETSAPLVLDAVLRGLGDIWPSRERLDGVNLGDVWTHSRFGRVPFHKLSQWLTYSLCDALERFGWVVTELTELTGLAEYRNGGLFVDLGVVVPRDASLSERAHAVDSDPVIEWRALTIALLDRTADGLRQRFGLSAEQLPLAKVLQAGTWSTGREVAAELRPDASPPLRVLSDGTVF